MAENDEILESMQSDILGLLQNTPKIKGHVFKDTEGDFESRLEKSLGTKTAGSTGKRGLAIIVLQVDVTEAEKNLPGPPLQLRARVLVIENIVVNRSVAKGTLQRSSQAALNILNVLQLAGFGTYIPYADKSPISPQPVPEGMSSHMVTLFVKAGMNPLDKPLPVQVSITAPPVVPGAGVVFEAASVLEFTCASAGSSIRYTTDGSYPSPAKTLYTTPFSPPAAGTVIRTAAYVAGMPPSDVLEFTITE